MCKKNIGPVLEKILILFLKTELVFHLFSPLFFHKKMRKATTTTTTRRAPPPTGASDEEEEEEEAARIFLWKNI